MRGTHPNICVATLTCVVWELLEGAHHGTCVASLCECSLQQQLINTGVRARARWAGGLRGGAGGSGAVVVRCRSWLCGEVHSRVHDL